MPECSGTFVKADEYIYQQTSNSSALANESEEDDCNESFKGSDSRSGRSGSSRRDNELSTSCQEAHTVNHVIKLGLVLRPRNDASSSKPCGGSSLCGRSLTPKSASSTPSWNDSRHSSRSSIRQLRPKVAARAPLPTFPGATRGPATKCCALPLKMPSSAGAASSTMFSSAGGVPPERSVQKSTFPARRPVRVKKFA